VVAASPNKRVGGALAPFKLPLHHLAWDETGQKPQLLTSKGARGA
jgi:hypothetical protein